MGAFVASAESLEAVVHVLCVFGYTDTSEGKPFVTEVVANQGRTRVKATGIGAETLQNIWRAQMHHKADRRPSSLVSSSQQGRWHLITSPALCGTKPDGQGARGAELSWVTRKTENRN